MSIMFPGLKSIFFQGLLIIRTYAFWKQNKKLLAVLLVFAAVRWSDNDSDCMLRLIVY
jgi:hypothetical protein